MFHSSNNNIHDPISYSDHEYLLTNFFHLPSPIINHELPVLIDNEVHNNDFFPHQQNLDLDHLDAFDGLEQLLTHHHHHGEQVSNKSEMSTIDQQIQKKRAASKKDRHSKINTAQGPRDRRVRLSLKVAKQFFALQDTLGFDKASKTVEWLFLKAKPEIKKLCSVQVMNNYSSSAGITKSGTASSTSDCEVVSGAVHEVTAVKQNTPDKGNSNVSTKETTKRTKTSRKASAFNPLAKESRVRARARARERTRKKMQSRRVMSESSTLLCEQSDNFNKIGDSLSLFEAGEESVTHQENLDATESMIDDSLAVISKWSTSCPFNRDLHHYSHGISLENQFGELQRLYKP